MYFDNYNDYDTCLSQNKLCLYQTQKLIHKTVRVPFSLYQNDLSAVSIYQKPVLKTGQNWNQMSDRALPHGQPGKPLSYGVDVKHNSYYRYYGRLKGRGPVLAERWPRQFGSPQLPYNNAFPIYGNKIFKTNILGMKCSCNKYYQFKNLAKLSSLSDLSTLEQDPLFLG
jgi:hypothetical protein